MISVHGFTGRVLDRIFSPDDQGGTRQVEFSRYLNLAFSRIALTRRCSNSYASHFNLPDGRINLSFNSILGIE